MEQAGMRSPPNRFQARTAVGSPGANPRRVLVADDERHVVRLIQVTLQSAGHEVITAYDGRECIEKLRESAPDLLILDVMMPYLDGFEVRRQIRRNPNLTGLPVIMLTAKSQDRDVFESYHYGADMYLSKPFNPRELLGFLRS